MLHLLILLAAALASMKGLSAVRRKELRSASGLSCHGRSAEYAGLALIYVAVLLVFYVMYGFIFAWCSRHPLLSLPAVIGVLTAGRFTSRHVLGDDVPRAIGVAMIPAFGFLFLVLLTLVY